MKNLSNWKIVKRYDSDDNMRHMGLLLLKSNQSKHGGIVKNITVQKYSKYEEGQLRTFWQVMNLTFLQFDLKSAFMYVRKTLTQIETEQVEKSLSDRSLIIGDINMDKNRAGDAIKIDILCKKRSQVLNEITTLWFNQLDYVLLDKALFPTYFATSFRNQTRTS